MSLYDKASLIQVPSLYKDGTLVSTVPEDRSGDFTFSRGSDISATRVNADGYIEKGYENLLLQSNSFTTSPWASNPILTPNQLGYDGSNDAWLVEKSAAFNNVGQSLSLSGVQTFSVYAKAGTQEWIRLRMSGSQTCYYHLFEDGYLGSNSGTISQSINSIGNGWYRCSMTINATTSSVNIYSAEDDSVMGAAGSIYIQDAMLNQGLVAYPYKETTTAPVAGGILEDMPRLDYSNGSCPALLLEPQRTNLIGYSEAIEFGISTNECTQTITNETNPSGKDVSYLASAIDDNNDQMRYDRNGLSLGSYFLSAFVKGDGNANKIRFRGTGGGVSVGNVYWDVSADGTITLNTSQSPSGVNAITESYGNGWYRIGFEETFDGTGRFALYPSNGDVNASTYIWGIQWEAGSYPTSYIPTYGVSQTRLHDDMTNNLQGLDISSILGVSSYTIFFDVETENTGSSLNVAGNVCAVENPSRRIAIDTRVSVIQDDSSSTTRIKVDVGDNIKHYKGALQVTPTTATIFGNGIKGQSGTSRNLSPNTLYVYNLVYNSDTYKMNKFILFPTALTDSECIELTTIS